MRLAPLYRLILAVAIAGCSGAAPTTSLDNHGAGAAGTLYESLLRVDQAWQFRVIQTVHPDPGNPNLVELGLLDPVRCVVASVRTQGAMRIARVTCTPADELGRPSPAQLLGGTYVATRDGLWKLDGSTEDGAEIVTPPAATMLLPASPARTRRETSAGSCLDTGANNSGLHAVDTLDPDHQLYALTPWRQGAWCVTRVWGCHSTWSVECYRDHVGWIGGATRGYFDPAVPQWTELRWGETPRFPFGVSN